MMSNRRLLPWCLCLLACVATRALADEPEKYALIAGVTKYQHADMNKAQLGKGKGVTREKVSATVLTLIKS